MGTSPHMIPQDEQVNHVKHSNQGPFSCGNLHVLDDLIRQRAADLEQSPILAYPAVPGGTPSYDYFSGRDLDRMIEKTAHALTASGLKRVGVGSPRRASRLTSAVSDPTRDGRPPQPVRFEHGNHPVRAQPTGLHRHDALSSAVSRGLRRAAGPGVL